MFVDASDESQLHVSQDETLPSALIDDPIQLVAHCNHVAEAGLGSPQPNLQPNSPGLPAEEPPDEVEPELDPDPEDALELVLDPRPAPELDPETDADPELEVAVELASDPEFAPESAPDTEVEPVVADCPAVAPERPLLLVLSSVAGEDVCAAHPPIVATQTAMARQRRAREGAGV